MMYINANDITEWRKTILIAAKDIACLRGNVSDEVITRLANTLKDMAFLVSYTASQLRTECDCTVAEEASKIKEEIVGCLKAEDERLNCLRRTSKQYDLPQEVQDASV